MPLNEITLYVEVRTFDIRTGALEQAKVFDYNVRPNRKWLARHALWAYLNGKMVLTQRTDKVPTFDVRATKGYDKRRKESEQ